MSMYLLHPRWGKVDTEAHMEQRNTLIQLEFSIEAMGVMNRTSYACIPHKHKLESR